jgi:hypothetical protein
VHVAHERLNLDAASGRRSPDAPVNALGYLRIMFAVEDIDDTLAGLPARESPSGIIPEHWRI